MRVGPTLHPKAVHAEVARGMDATPASVAQQPQRSATWRFQVRVDAEAQLEDEVATRSRRTTRGRLEMRRSAAEAIGRRSDEAASRSPGESIASKVTRAAPEGRRTLGTAWASALSRASIVARPSTRKLERHEGERGVPHVGTGKAVYEDDQGPPVERNGGRVGLAGRRHRLRRAAAPPSRSSSPAGDTTTFLTPA